MMMSILGYTRAGACAGICGLLLFASVLDAQPSRAELRVLIKTTDGRPIAGALVALLDSQDRVVVEQLTWENGARHFRVPSGAYRVRVRRIGFRPFVSEAVSVPRDGDLVLSIASNPVVLSAVVVTGTSSCKVSDRSAHELGLVWDEVAKALRSSQLTLDDLAGVSHALIYRKAAVHGAVVSTDTTIFTVRDRRPFGAVDPRTLAEEGYVRGNERSGWQYFAPDETVLLSDQFAATHCFRLVREVARAGQIGVAFEPVPRRRVPDIAGVLWVDQRTSELREMEFRFVNTGVLDRFPASGFTRFRRMASGAWIVEEWRLRGPRLAITAGAREPIESVGYVEDGGGIIIGRGASASRGTGVVRGTVYDSLANRPLQGALVQLEGATATTDNAGGFTFLNVPQGSHLISFSYPALSALGVLAFERPIAVGADTVNIELATPSKAAMWVRICADTAEPALVNERGILHGFVRDESGEPVSGAKVQVLWTEYAPSAGTGTDVYRLQLDVVSDDAGHYSVCGLRRLARGSVALLLGRNPVSRREFTFGPSLVARRDLLWNANAPSQAAPENVEVLVIVTDSTGAPIADATVFVDGTSVTARTDDTGQARIRVSGRQLTFTVRRIGFSELTLRATLRENGRQQLRVALSPIRTLATVEVISSPPLPAALERRRRLGRGYFYDAQDVRKAPNLKTLLVRTPGAELIGSARWGIRFRHPNGGACWADLYIDGTLSSAGVNGLLGAGVDHFEALESYSPLAVYAIEVYPRASEAPAEFTGTRDGCGSVFLWTRTYVEHELAAQQARQERSAGDPVPPIR